MNPSLYKQQMAQLRPHQPESYGWEDFKGVLGGLTVFVVFPLLAIAAFASVIAAIVGLLR